MKERNNLELELRCNRQGQTSLAHQYTSQPLRLSKLFRLDTLEKQGAYLYLMNSSPGLLAGDQLSLSLTLQKSTLLYLTDQAATKVHAMPKPETIATIDWEINLQAKACLEFVPEPVILYAQGALEQNTRIRLDDSASLFWSEILLPGRLAKGEYYDFRSYYGCLEIYSELGELWFKDAMNLQGTCNSWKHHKLFTSEPILANLVLVQPQIDLDLLSKKLEDFVAITESNLIFAKSILPEQKGLLVRVMAEKTTPIKQYINHALNCIRHLSDRPRLPYIPK